MRTEKRVLSVLLVIAFVLCIMHLSAYAAGANVGYMLPVNNKFTKTLSTVNVYGTHDYINFILDCKNDFYDFGFAVFSDSKYENPVAYYPIYFVENGKQQKSKLIDLSDFKSGTYYCMSFAYADWGDRDIDVAENSIKTFKLTVNKTKAIDKQVVILKSASSSVDGPVIKWNKLSGATKYIVYRRPATGSNWTKLGSTKSTSYIDKTIKSKSGNYVYTVRAQDKTGTLSRYHYMGVEIHFVGAPKINYVKASGNDISVKWNAVRGATSYVVYRKTEGGKWKIMGTTYNQMSFTDKSTKLSGTRYYYTVRAETSFNNVGEIKSAYYPGKPIVYVKAPSVSSIVTTSDNTNIIKWRDVGDSTYVIYRKIEGSGWTILAKGYRGDSFRDTTDKKDGEKYIYTVRATQMTPYGEVQGHYVVSEPFEFTSMPENIGINGAESGVEITWDSVASAKRYTVYIRSIDGASSWVKLGTTQMNKFIDTVSGVNGARIYTVRSEGTSVRGSYSGDGVVYFNPDAPVLAVEGKEGYYTISWEAVEGADSYAVYKKLADGEWELLGTTTELSFADILTQAGVYSYSVTALRRGVSGNFNDVGDSVEYCVDSASVNFNLK